MTALEWVNVRREWLGRPPLDRLLAPDDGTDPISFSLGARWVLGCLQVEIPQSGSIGQYDVPPHIHRWLAEWRAGQHPEYTAIPGGFSA